MNIASHSVSFTAPQPFQPTESADPLKIFKKYLKHVYQQRRESLNFFEELSLDSSEEEFVSLCLFNFSNPSNNKEIIKMSDLGKCTDEGSTKPASSIFVMGDPGIGKSTFAWKCCQKWANGEILQDWSIVIFIQLSNQRVREAKLLSDFIYYPQEAMREVICQKLVTTKGRKVLFVIDSFDQVDEQQMSGTVFQQLVDKTILRHATLMVLGRPTKSWRGRLYPYLQKLKIDQHVKISGFNVDHYIASACSGELLAALTSYLSSHPLIYSQMNIPVHSALVASLFRLHWNHGDTGFSPNTLTELYTDLVRTLLLRYLSNHPEYSQMEWVIEEFTDLPDKAKKSFNELARMAAKGIEEGRYVFDLPKECETLCLMQKVRGVYYESELEFSSDKEYYCFLHLSLQEYLAAYYCSLQENPTEVVLNLLKLDRSYEFPSIAAVDPPPSSILSYYQFSSSKNNHCTVVLFAVGISRSKMVQALSESIETSRFQVFSSLHLLYETQSSDLIRHIFSTLETPGCKFLELPHHTDPLDSFVAGYCIPHSNKLWLLDNKKFVGKNQEHFQALSKGLNMTSDQCTGHIATLENVYSGISVLKLLHPHTQKLSELGIGIHDDSDEEYSDFPSFFPLLKTLKVKTSTVSQFETPRFAKSFVSFLENLPSMRSLKILCVELDTISKPADTVLKQLRECHSLEHLEITCINVRTVSDKSCQIPQFAISSKLESLTIARFELTFDPFLIENNSLKTLKLNSCKIPDDACDALVDFLQSSHCILETFELYDSDDLQYGIPDKLLVAIGSSRTLKRCVLDRFRGSIVQHFVTGMKNISSQSRLEDLTVICSSFCRDLEQEYFDELIRVVNKQNTITQLKLNDFFEDSVRKCDIRDTLNIKTDCIYTYVR